MYRRAVQYNAFQRACTRFLLNGLTRRNPSTKSYTSPPSPLSPTLPQLNHTRTLHRPRPQAVLVYLLNGLANVAVADESLSDFVGQHGACQAVVLALEQRPRDLQLQASGVKAVRALALAGGRNVEVLAAVRGPQAIARAQGLFLRDREVCALGSCERFWQKPLIATHRGERQKHSFVIVEPPQPQPPPAPLYTCEGSAGVSQCDRNSIAGRESRQSSDSDRRGELAPARECSLSVRERPGSRFPGPPRPR